MKSCRRCGGTETNEKGWVRGLCFVCVRKLRYWNPDELYKYPRTTWVNEDLIEVAEREKQRRPDLSWNKIAEVIGVTPGALSIARRRARKRSMNA